MSEFPRGLSREDRLTIDRAEDPVLFYSQYEEWGEFSQFSDHAVTLPHPFTGRPFCYLDGEHRFQAMKAQDLDAHDWVAKAPGPMDAKERGRSVELRSDWGDTRNSMCWYAMFEVSMAKALQHEDVLQRLFETGERHIYEDSPYDDIWGWRKRQSYHGKNLLGQAWMHVRGILLG